MNCARGNVGLNEIVYRLKELRDLLMLKIKPRDHILPDGKPVRDFAVGCAFCQFNVPCMDTNPVAKKQMREQQDNRESASDAAS